MTTPKSKSYLIAQDVLDPSVVEEVLAQLPFSQKITFAPSNSG